MTDFTIKKRVHTPGEDWFKADIPPSNSWKAIVWAETDDEVEVYSPVGRYFEDNPQSSYSEIYFPTIELAMKCKISCG